MGHPVKLNLGACDRNIEGFLSVDIVPPADIIADLSKHWPWEDSSVNEVRAFDIFEHLPDKRHTMNELWRVLQPGGIAKIEVPSAVRGAGAFQDPTHCSYWTANDFEYYEKGNYARERFRNSAYYGVKADFKLIALTQTSYRGAWDEVWKITVMLEAVK
jgi:predicted SAM-dependent methyltransferase